MEAALTRLAQLYHDIDRQSRELEMRHVNRLQCRRGCCDCCVDEITVFEIEAENIRRHYPELLAQGRPHPPGACAFLDENGTCRIYAHRPYVCRTQGLPLRWRETRPAGEVVELRDICPLNETEEPIETLPPEACWEIGPFEARLARLQAELDGGQLRRISLRRMFGDEKDDAS